MRPLEIARQRLMENRHQGRPLPAGRDIGGAKIIGHRHAEPLRQRRAVADLHRQSGSRLMQDRLAMKADQRDVAARDMFGFEKGFDRFGMGAGDKVLGFCQHARPRMALGQAGAVGQRGPQQRPLVIRVWPVTDRPEGQNASAIGLDQRHVDAVERSPAHQPNGLNRPQTLALSADLFGMPARRLNPVPDLIHHPPPQDEQTAARAFIP